MTIDDSISAHAKANGNRLYSSTVVNKYLFRFTVGNGPLKSMFSLSKGCFALTLLIPSYFGPTLYTRGVIWTPCYLINTWLYKPQILQGIRDTLQGLRKHKVCKKSFVWLPWQLFDNLVLLLIIVKTSMKNRYFSNASRNHKLEGVKIKLCVMIVLFLYFSKK